MSKALRHKMVDELAGKFRGQKNIVLVNAQGLTGNQTVELRAQLREVQVKMRLMKNSVALHIFKKLGLPGFDPHLSGMTALVYGPDPLAIAKKLVAYREKNQRPEVKCAWIEGKVMGAAEVVALSRLPGREAILASLFGTMNAVTQKFVSTLNEIPRSFVATLLAVSGKK